MSAQSPALAANAAGHEETQPTQPSNTTRRRLTGDGKPWTLAQEETARDLSETYGLDLSQIGYESQAAVEPILDFEALSKLALELSDIPSITIEPFEVDSINNMASSTCLVTLSNGKTRQVFASCMVGETMPDGSPVETLKQALDISQPRALRKGLRSVGFDVMRAHRERSPDNTLTLSLNIGIRELENREIHLYAGKAGLIVGEDKTRYYKLMDFNFPGVRSSKDMTDFQRAKWLAIVKALAKAEEATVWQNDTPQS